MNEKGFTLIEMMIVLLVISILIIITIPNMTKQQGVIRNKGCDAYVNMVLAQMEAYKMENSTTINPTIEELETGGYIPRKECPNGEVLEISSSGEVTVVQAP
jgi:prepilin-type N-terminal cleavage/methylation domain-containing protein